MLCLKKHIFYSHIRTRLVALLLARFVANRRPYADLRAVGRGAISRAQNHPQAAFLQYVDVVVVRVAHRPAGRVLLHVLVAGQIHAAAMAIRPIGERVQFVSTDFRHHRIHNIPVRIHGGQQVVTQKTNYLCSIIVCTFVWWMWLTLHSL